MNSLPNHHFQNKSFYQLSFDGGHLTQYGGLIFFQELFSQLKLKERISKYLVTNDQRRYCRYSDSDILEQVSFFSFRELADTTLVRPRSCLIESF
ncbi:transposase [Streptococcus pneumoniae]|uniref:transposase n=1 Tax=Streptococcus pneumoniae TaxID=1313 RepID=UPI000E00E47F|nr:transposase [Streptococcus pneumoniae]SUO15010.1 IS1380-Spn1 transposase [Streptococcus pneumoniae]VJC11157.1 IS1380-Spn1 transposase [Streptococcus pneumoniae]